LSEVTNASSPFFASLGPTSGGVINKAIIRTRTH
jgi:hypothetical protein